MDIRTLSNFLHIARTGNMTRSSEALHITQSALSKQIKELEQSFGRALFVRSGSGMRLTGEGALLRKRAEDIVTLYEKTRREFESLGEVTGGDVHVGAPESCHMAIFARELLAFRRRCPGLRCHLMSGMTGQVTRLLDEGLLDFAIISGQPDLGKYNSLRYPADDQWGVVARRDHRLARLASVRAEDLMGERLIMSTQGFSEEIRRWCGEKADSLSVTDTVNLCYNGSVFVREKVSVMLSYRGLADTSEESGLAWIPLEPALMTPAYLIWRKYQTFSPAAGLFLRHLREAFAGTGGDRP